MSVEQPVGVSLAWLLDLERVDRDVFMGKSPHYTGRLTLFGGQVAAQALMAASRTVEVDHRPHSLHLYFMRPGRIGQPVVLYVGRVRDGRSFTTRNVIAQQNGEAILTMSTSFHRHEPGELAYQRPKPDAPGPEELAAAGATDDKPSDGPNRHGYVPSDTLTIPMPEGAGVDPSPARARYWVRLREALADDPLVHACALTYLSDWHTGAAPMKVSGRTYAELMMTSLDHALHFHQFVRADDWLLVDCEAVAVLNSRGMGRMTIHGRDGSLAATVQQELLMRERSIDRPAPRALGDPDRL